MIESSRNPALHWIAIATAAMTFPLIFIGGLVTTKGAGMSVPDWPNSYGYNMFLFPPSQWIGGVFWEHTHRLWASSVGFLAIVLSLFAWGPARTSVMRKWIRVALILFAMAAFVIGLILVVIKASAAPNLDVVVSRSSHAFVGSLSLALVLTVAYFSRYREPRRYVRWMALGVLLAVVAQGVLGGLRVTKINLSLAILHGVFAQAVFCLMTLTVLVTGRLWNDVASRPAIAGTGNFTRWAVVGVLTVFLQLILGATMRHNGAGLAVPDLPLHYGKLLPPTDEATLAEANLARANSGSPDLRPVTLTQIWLHVSHRIGAVLVTAVLCAIMWKVFRQAESRGWISILAGILAFLLLVQLTLGVLTVLQHKPADIATLHVATGALVLITVFSLGALAVRSGGIAAGTFLAMAHDTGRTPADRQNAKAAPIVQ